MFKTEASRERWTLAIALAAVFISIGALLVAYLQLPSSDRAVAVAEHAREDAATEAEKQRIDAKATLDQQRKDSAAALEGQSKRADRANALADRSAKAAEETGKVAAEQLEANERPWIKILDVIPTGDQPIVGGLSFQKIGPFKDVPDIRVQGTLQIKLSFTNIGHSVAEVTPSMELFMPQFSTSEYWSRISTEEHRFCGSSDTQAVTSQKMTVFPGEQKPSEWNAGISTPVRPENISHIPEGSGITPALIVCVSYRHKGLPSLYQTRAVYEISHEGTGARFFDVGPCDLHPLNIAPFTFCEGGVAAKMLRFSRDYNGDEAY